ncbi:MAG TPA: 50S ribosomal protein L25/general stress protein Ctc [Gemmatimonadaceae bacterium]|jgi:large subunit ribosomal protein L25|nr:50S ribosomal protein L25/general stress protein Ctc [Gemmatimonadaceae bacterium]
MAIASLSASLRQDTGKGVARKLRQSGQLPAVIYGHGRQPQGLSLNTREVERLFERIATASTVIELDISGTTARTLIREIQRHPFRKQILHIDFQELVAGEKVTVEVPLVFVGTPEGVRTGGGILDQVMHAVSIEVDPSDIPNHINVDVSGLTIGHGIHVRDLVLPAGVEVLDDADATICVVSAPKTATEEVPGAAEVAAEPELIRKPKAEEGEAEEK